MTASERLHTKSSWEGAGVYQIYPNTFKEVRDEPEEYTGRGNLRGIIDRRDYLLDLGVKAIWISPFYPSPMIDGGYDIADYEGIDPELGTLDDFDSLIAAYHEVGMKVMIDLVPNHTSDEHPWFQESKSSPDNPKRDWYIWHDPAPGGGPANNWTSVFSIPQLRARQRGELIVPEGENTPAVSAWQFDEASGQYYLRDFAAEQPNLNWQNPEVRDAIKDVMRTWLRRGVDGFRVDVANHLGKDPLFRDEAPNPNYIEGVNNPHDQHMQYYSLNYPDALYGNSEHSGYLEELASVLTEEEFQTRDLRMVLECWMKKDDLQKVDRVAPNVATSFNFTRLKAPRNAEADQRLLTDYFAGLPAGSIGNQVLSNHDVPRVASRLGRDAARAAAVVNLTLPRVMNFIYNGEEGGLTDVNVPPDRRKDTELGERDGARVPIPWDDSFNAGFSQASPDSLWLPTNPDYLTNNLTLQAQDPNSSFSLYRALLRLRNGSDTLRHGTYHPLPASHEDVLAFAGRQGNDQTMTISNYSERPVHVAVYDTQQVMGRVILSSLAPHANRFVSTDEPLFLAPNEAVVIVPTA